ncbi:hypothetical protein HZS_3267 [Henneguya salminicola]|nr:hypothetical protein HZS_3267 [Henneguya salminicola]
MSYRTVCYVIALVIPSLCLICILGVGIFAKIDFVDISHIYGIPSYGYISIFNFVITIPLFFAILARFWYNKILSYFLMFILILACICLFALCVILSVRRDTVFSHFKQQMIKRLTTHVLWRFDQAIKNDKESEEFFDRIQTKVTSYISIFKYRCCGLYGRVDWLVKIPRIVDTPENITHQASHDELPHNNGLVELAIKASTSEHSFRLLVSNM